jgi:hypothetical protein
MKIRWIKLRSNGEIDKSVSERDIPAVGDGIFLDDAGYKVVGVANTPHLDCAAHVCQSRFIAAISGSVGEPPFLINRFTAASQRAAVQAISPVRRFAIERSWRAL